MHCLKVTQDAVVLVWVFAAYISLPQLCMSSYKFTNHCFSLYYCSFCKKVIMFILNMQQRYNANPWNVQGWKSIQLPKVSRFFIVLWQYDLKLSTSPRLPERCFYMFGLHIRNSSGANEKTAKHDIGWTKKTQICLPAKQTCTSSRLKIITCGTTCSLQSPVHEFNLVSALDISHFLHYNYRGIVA